MEHSVPLQQLPQGLEFPEKLKDRICFDADKKRLIFRGFMSKGEFDALTRLSQELEFYRAVEGLFRQSSEPDAPPLRRSWRVLAVVAMLSVGLGAAAWWRLNDAGRPVGAQEQPPPTVGSQSDMLLFEVSDMEAHPELPR